jgi:hypothetical protein
VQIVLHQHVIMKTLLMTATFLIIVAASCETLFNDSEEYLFKADNGLKYRYSDFQLYDSSTHIFYFRESHPEFKTDKFTRFSIMADGEEVYNGNFYEPYSSSMPFGPFIGSFIPLYQDYAFQIGFLDIDNQPEDPRNDPRIIQTLKRHNLLHQGLALSIDTVEINGTLLKFVFSITNKDESSLLIMDPGKMGINLFHYFTNGLLIYNQEHVNVFTNDIFTEKPVPWNSWKSEWLSELKPGESRNFTFNYKLNSQMEQGTYFAIFEFPGLSYQIEMDQLFQGNSRIFLGEITRKKTIKVK